MMGDLLLNGTVPSGPGVRTGTLNSITTNDYDRFFAQAKIGNLQVGGSFELSNFTGDFTHIAYDDGGTKDTTTTRNGQTATRVTRTDGYTTGLTVQYDGLDESTATKIATSFGGDPVGRERVGHGNYDVTIDLQGPGQALAVRARDYGNSGEVPFLHPFALQLSQARTPEEVAAALAFNEPQEVADWLQRFAVYFGNPDPGTVTVQGH
jgi:hypothetical protein